MNNAQIALWAIEMTVKYGAPAVKKLIETWTDDTKVTVEMVKKLEANMATKTPESYFEKQ